MESYLPADIFQTASILIFSIILIHIVSVMISRIRRMTFEKTQQNLTINLLKAKVNVAKGHLAQSEKASRSWNGFRKFRVLRKVKESKDVFSYYLMPHDGKPLPSFKPGQFLTIKLPIPDQNGRSEKDVVRCYSLSESPDQANYYRISIKRQLAPESIPDALPGVMSNYFHDHITRGDILDVKSPAGNFFLDMTRSTPIVLVAGGIGITPLLSMINATIHSNSKREVWLFLGFRSKEDHIFKKHLQKIYEENENFHLHVCYSAPTKFDQLGLDYHFGERISVKLIRRLLPSNNYEFYVCGGPQMVNSLTDGLKKWGVPEKDIHFEAFGQIRETKEDSISEPSVESGNKALFSRGKIQMTAFQDFGPVKWSLVWRSISQNGELREGNENAVPEKKFMGWVLTVRKPGWQAVAGFGPCGKFLRGSLHPSSRMTRPLRDLISELIGKKPHQIIRYLQAYSNNYPQRAEALDVSVWITIFAAFTDIKKAANATSLPASNENGSGLGTPEEASKVNVTFAKSKKTVAWDSSSGSLLDFALENGVDIDSGCRAGNCGSCVIAMKNGKVQYLRNPGTEPEEGECLPCISVPKENLTLHA